PRRDGAFDFAEPRVDVLGFFVPEHLYPDFRAEGVYETPSGSSSKRGHTSLHPTAHELRLNRKISANLRLLHGTNAAPWPSFTNRYWSTRSSSTYLRAPARFIAMERLVAAVTSQRSLRSKGRGRSESTATPPRSKLLRL